MLLCVRNLGPPPELVRQRETKWINIIQQWDRILLKKTGKVCLSLNTLKLEQTTFCDPPVRIWTFVTCVCMNVPSGQSAVSERHPRLTQSQVLAPAVWSYRQDEATQKPLPGKNTTHRNHSKSCHKSQTVY